MDFSEEDILRTFAEMVSPRALLTQIEKLLAEGHVVDAPLIERENWKIILNVRPEVGETRPEMHRDWHDVSIYLLGANAISVGDSLRDAFEKETGNGEWRAGTIVNERTIQVQADGLLFVPAGIPHQNHLAENTAFLVLKVRKGSETDAPFPSQLTDWQTVQPISGYLV